MKQKEYIDKLSEQVIPASSVVVIRDWLIPEILSNHSDTVMYWSGKKLARSFPCESIQEVMDFFEKVGFGTLTVLSTKKHEMEFQLSGEIVASRFDLQSSPSFYLEAGFLSQQIQAQKQVVCESIFTTKRKAKVANFTVQWDQKDLVVNE
ncbi:YslB family protein [Bacillus carboniphilus]|uniref:YslB family protein n=1 Tax=Bacillus carboniphilus TaxID=86663 RepID=A0ABN0WDD9_9BACI